MNNQTSLIGRGFIAAYIIIMFVLVFTGFGQMPIFKRYYIADLPGMAWSADFFFTLTIHYLAGAALLALTAYYLTLRFAARQGLEKLNGKAWLRGILLGILIVSGIILAARNMESVNLPKNIALVSTIAHIGSTMLFMLASVTIFRFGKSKTG